MNLSKAFKLCKKASTWILGNLFSILVSMLFKKLRTYPLLLIILSGSAYLNTLGHDFVLDDFSVIKENFVVQKGLEGIPEIFETHYRHGYGYSQANLYRPLTLSVFALQWEIVPDQPYLGHLFNLLFYALCVFLLFYWLIKLWGRDYLQLAFFTCLIFAIHPIHTEVVANIKSLDDLLAMSLSILAARLHLNYVDHSKKKSLYASIFLFFLAFLSKESAVLFLGFIPLSLYLFRDIDLKTNLKRTAYLLLPFVAFLIMRLSVLGSLSGDKSIARLDNLLMAAPNQAVKIATAIKILGLYLQKLIFPHPLMNDYSLNQITLSDFRDWRVWLSFLIYSALIYLFFKLKRSKPMLAFGIGIYLIGISLYSNLFITIGTSFGERLLFLPSIGFSIAIAYLLLSLSKGTIKGIKLKQATTSLVILICILAMYAFKTIHRNAAWKDNFTLYSTDVENCDQSARCHYYYGLGLMSDRAVPEANPQKKQQFLRQSVNAFSRALEILPTYSDAYGQKGLAHYRLKEFDLAMLNYDKAVQFNPQNATALSNRGTLLFEAGDYQKAKASFEQALGANPNHVDALSNYASTLGTLGEYQSSIYYFKKAIALKPNVPTYYQMIGLSYQNLGQAAQARYYLQKAEQLRRESSP